MNTRSEAPVQAFAAACRGSIEIRPELKQQRRN
jgi:hypothetical protein